MLTKKQMTVSGAVGFIIGAAFVLISVFTSSNSTAVIGLLFVPVYGIVGALISMAALYLFLKNQSTRLLLGLCLLLFLYSFYSYRSARHAAQNPQSSSADLISLMQKFYFWGHRDIVLEVARNPSINLEVLNYLSEINDSEVRYLVLKNPLTPSEVLRRYSSGKTDSYLRAAIASNPNIPNDLTQELMKVTPKDFPSQTEYKLYQTYVLGYLARNPALSDDDFKKLMNWPDQEYFLIYGLVESGRASCKYLAQVAEGPHTGLHQNAKSRLQQQNCKRP